MSDTRCDHHLAIPTILLTLLGLYVFFPALLFVPLTAAARHHLISEESSENLTVVLAPLEKLANALPAYDRLMENEVGFCKRHGLLPTARLR